MKKAFVMILIYLIMLIFGVLIGLICGAKLMDPSISPYMCTAAIGGFCFLPLFYSLLFLDA